jgi:hypothetical protein
MYETYVKVKEECARRLLSMRTRSVAPAAMRTEVEQGMATGPSGALRDHEARAVWGKPWRDFLLLFLLSRLLLTVIGVSSRILLEPFHGKEYVWVYSQHLWLDIWGVWDSGWFLNVAVNGYSTAASQAAVTLNQTNYAFFPLYPLLMRIPLFSPFAMGILVSNASLLFACFFLYRLVRLDSDSDTAFASVKYMLLFPTSFILSGVFSESLFLALSLACFFYARKRPGNTAAVGTTGFLFALTRANAPILLPSLLLGFWSKRGDRREILKAIGLLGIPLGLAAFALYLRFLTGDWLAVLHIRQQAWGHRFTNPFLLLWNSLHSSDVTVVINAGFTILCLVALLVFVKRIDFSYWLLAILSIGFLLISGEAVMHSMMRYTVVLFPLFILAARLSRNRTVDHLLTIAFSFSQAFLMVFWSNGFTLVI